MALNNLLNTLGFGATIQSGGKPYTAVLRLTDRLFVVMEQNAQLPAPLMLAQVDIVMGPGQEPGNEPPAPPAPGSQDQGPGGPTGSGPGGQQSGPTDKSQLH